MKKNADEKSTDLTKVYEKYYFDQSKFKCLIDVEK